MLTTLDAGDIGTYLAVGVALTLGLIAVFDRRRERRQNLQRTKRNAKRLKFQIATELSNFQDFLESTKRKQPEPHTDNIDFGTIVPPHYADTLKKLELYYGQSTLLNDLHNRKLETVICFLQIVVIHGRLGKDEFDSLISNATILGGELWDKKSLSKVTKKDQREAGRYGKKHKN